MASKPKVPGGAQTPFTVTQRLRKARSTEYTLQSLFKYGYRNKEDISNLPPSALVVGSQNVLTNAAELVGIRQGYTLDGPPGGGTELITNGTFTDTLSPWTVQPSNPGWTLGTNQANYSTNGGNDGIIQQDISITPFETYQVQLDISATSTLSGYVQLGSGNPVSFNTTGTVVLTVVAGNANGQIWISGDVASLPFSITNVSTTLINNPNNYGIDSAYDFLSRQGNYENLRKWGPNLDVRYMNPQLNSVQWINLLATLTPGKIVNFTNFWDFNTEVKMFCLFVNGDNNIYEWSGGVGSFASATSSTITLSGNLSTDQLGFYSAGGNSAKFLLNVDGVQYTYTGVSAQTFTGVTPDPTAAGIAVGDAVIQQVASINGTNVTTNGSGNLGSSFEFDLIATLENQVWYGSYLDTKVYVSKTNNYQDVSFTTPARLPAEGALLTLDSYSVGFFPQSSEMYMTAGTDQWWISEKNQQTIDVSGIATPTETISAFRLKTARNQAAQSQGLIGQFKNSLVFVSNEQIINALGLVKDIQVDPQVTNMSDPIKYDIDAYDFTGGQVLYDNYFIYVTIPAMSVVRMYNVVKQYWEAPQTLPVSRFYRITDGSSIYAHSSLTNESYQMFTGYNDNGNPINAVAAFPYVSVVGGAPPQKKNFNKLFTEGYISSNTTLLATINYDFGGFTGTYSAQISGNQGGSSKQTIFNKVTDGSLGQNTLGSQPIGTILNLPQNNPKFRIINTMPRLNCFEYQIVYSSNDVDFQWTLLRWGPSVAPADDIGVEITI